MSDKRCPLCNQALPASITPSALESKLRHLPQFATERRRIEKEFADKVQEEKQRERQRLTADFQLKINAEREEAKRAAQRAMSARLSAETKRADKAVAEAERVRQQHEKEFAAKLQRQMSKAITEAEEKSEARLDKERKQRDKERVQHEVDRLKWQTQLDSLSRKLEAKSGERLGEEGELDLESELRRAFPQDDVRRVGRGTKGADIVHRVFDGANEVGKIIYENKNVSGWSNAFVAQAGKYAAQYETPFVMIVTRAFPRKERDFCIVQKIPVVRPRIAIALARVMRSSVIAVGRLRLSGAGRDEKAQELMEYLTSDRFTTRFVGISEGVDSLREQQQKEKTWHENAWESRNVLHDKIDKSRREIDAQLQAILTTKKPVAIAARA
jgi:hypothetical protein